MLIQTHLTEWLDHIIVKFCDGSHITDYLWDIPHSFSKIYEKPIAKITVVSYNVSDKYLKDHFSSVSRGCLHKSPNPVFTCGDVQMPRELSYIKTTPISFKSDRTLVSAALVFPGVDGEFEFKLAGNNYGGWELLPNNIIKYEGWRWLPDNLKSTLDFNPSELRWEGIFYPLPRSGEYFLPRGVYHGVWLQVRNDYGQQAKCPVGDVVVD